MSDRKIEPFELQGKIIYIEVTEAEVEPGLVLPPASEPELPSHMEHTSARDKLVSAGDAMRDTIAALAETVHQGIAHLAPDEWKMEVTLGFKGKTGIPYVAEGEANGAVKISATWKRPLGA
jgi:hypothetical protein